MKIAIWHNLPSGGGKRALYDQVAGLKGRGHEIEAWCPPTAQVDYLPLANVGVRENVVALAPAVAGRSRRIAEQFGHLFSSVSPDEARRARAMDDHSIAVSAQIHARKFDVLLAHPCRFYAAPAIGRHVNLPSALYLQEPFRAFYEAMPELPWLADNARDVRGRFQQAKRLRAIQMQGRQEKVNAQAFDLLLVNSLFSRESILRAYGLDSRVCLLGVDTKRFSNLHLPREAMVIGLGSIHPHKNVDLIIKAIAAMRSPRPRLVWIGNASDSNYLAELRALASAGGVVFEPKMMISDVEICNLLNRATVMAYAPRLEPFGYAPLEANACGVPVVAVAEGGVRETVVDGRNGLLVEHDPGSIAAAITRLMDDADLLRQMGAAGRAWVEERFSLSAATDALEKHLQSLVAARQD